MRRAQSVLVRGKVYIGGGDTDRPADAHLVFQYQSERDGWATLPPCPVRNFALGQFQGHLITVGGQQQLHRTGKVYCFNQKWKKVLKPMPTARSYLSIITTESAIIACGGDIGKENCANVEVYMLDTDQWYTALFLPIGCASMTSIIIADTCYLLGGNDSSFRATKTVLYAQVTSLIEQATSPLRSSTSTQHRSVSLWNTLPDTPLNCSTAASLGGHLLAVGGFNDHLNSNSQAVGMFLPDTNRWARIASSDLPAAVRSVTAIELPDNTLLVCGGRDSSSKRMKTVYMWSITF